MTRKTVSLLALFTLVLLILSSLALYLLPGGRAAASMAFLGVSKSAWRDVHITGGFLFLAIALWHSAIHAATLFRYMRSQKTAKGFAPVALALAVTALVYGGTVMGLEPMRSVLDFGKSTRSAHARLESDPLRAAWPEPPGREQN